MVCPPPPPSGGREGGGLPVRCPFPQDIRIIIAASSRIVAWQDIAAKTFQVTLTASMAPRAHVVAYYTRSDGEVVASATAIAVAFPATNALTAAFNTSSAAVAADVTLALRAAAHSRVFLLAADRSTSLLGDATRINAAALADAFAAPEAASGLSACADGVFKEAGLLAMFPDAPPCPRPPSSACSGYGGGEVVMMEGAMDDGDVAKVTPPSLSTSAGPRSNVVCRASPSQGSSGGVVSATSAPGP